MPLVRIDLRKGKDAAYRQQVARAVYDAMLSVGVPVNDRFEVINEHDAGNFQYDPGHKLFYSSNMAQGLWRAVMP